MKTNKSFLIAALLGVTLAGCQLIVMEEAIPNDEEEQTISEKLCVLTVDATKGAETKALAIDGSNIKAYWTVGEKVDVYLAGNRKGTLSVTATSNEGGTATLSGTVDATGLVKDSELMLLFPGRDDHSWVYTGQDGTAPSEDGSMATGYDYAKASLTVNAVDGETVTVNEASVTFTNQQSVYRFGFKVSESYIDVDNITVTSNQDKFVRSLSYVGSAWTPVYGSISVTANSVPGDHFYYMTIRNENTSADDTYTFSVVDHDTKALYEGSKTIPSSYLDAPKFLSLKNISVTQKSFAPAASGEVDGTTVLVL